MKGWENKMEDFSGIEERHWSALYDEYNREVPEEKKHCAGEDCNNYVDEDETLCNECKKTIQKCYADFKSQFNEEEQEYLEDFVR
jgi:hypothetical protein